MSGITRKKNTIKLTHKIPRMVFCSEVQLQWSYANNVFYYQIYSFTKRSSLTKLHVTVSALQPYPLRIQNEIQHYGLQEIINQQKYKIKFHAFSWMYYFIVLHQQHMLSKCIPTPWGFNPFRIILQCCHCKHANISRFFLT